jgi:hypothetical protein
MKKAIVYLIILQVFILNTGKAGSIVSAWGIAVPPPDSNRLIQVPVSPNRELNTGEVFISPGIGYGDMTIAGSPIANTIFTENNNYYGNLYQGTILPEYGASLDYLVSQSMSMGLAANYQSVTYTQTNSQQPYNQNQYYPYSVQFSRVNIGMRNLFYFPGNNSDNFHLYIGVRAGLSLWYEVDNWSNNTNNNNNYYREVIDSYDNTHLSIQVIWGVRYFVTPDIGMQLELALGTPYYAQFGITFRLNDKPATYSVTRSEYRAINEGTQLTHRDSANLGLLHPQPGIKK